VNLLMLMPLQASEYEVIGAEDITMSLCGSAFCRRVLSGDLSALQGYPANPRYYSSPT
jgi:hypothetical protein